MKPYKVECHDLAEELELCREFDSANEVLLLSLLRTRQLLERTSASFFERFDLTATQFNALMIIRDWEKLGVKATELARRLVINRASAGTLVDSLCAKSLIERHAVAGDRRSYHLRLTRLGRRRLRNMQPEYYSLLDKGFQSFSQRTKEVVTRFLGELRDALTMEADRDEAPVAERRSS